MDGTLHAATDADGRPWLLFFAYAGPELHIDRQRITKVDRAARSLNRVVDVWTRDENGAEDAVCFVGPSGAIKKVFAHLGYSV